MDRPRGDRGIRGAVSGGYIFGRTPPRSGGCGVNVTGYYFGESLVITSNLSVCFLHSRFVSRDSYSGAGTLILGGGKCS